MAERWQSAEGRSAAVYVDDVNGNPATGLACTAVTLFKDGTAGAPAATVTEVGSGFYRVDLASAPSKDVLVRVATAEASPNGYIALEIPVGGYVNNVDAATSSRSTPAQVTAAAAPLATSAGLTSAVAPLATASALGMLVTAIGTPAQASALAALVTSVGTPAQASALASLATAVGSPAQASVLASVVTSLGSPAQAAAVASIATSITALGAPAQAAALSLLAAAMGTPAQASVLAGVAALVDVAVSTRAKPSDVQVTVTGGSTSSSQSASQPVGAVS